MFKQQDQADSFVGIWNLFCILKDCLKTIPMAEIELPLQNMWNFA